MRTNYLGRAARDGRRKPYLAFKLESAKVPELPEPRPLFEIFVYSPRFEAIHLRGGKVARGGLRWSDRPEDFRTEVLGLMKAQMVKNAVIVPVGSKGGFVLKAAPPAGRARGVPEGGRGLLPGFPARTPRPHRQPEGRRSRAAAGRRAPRPGRSLPRGRGGQGHRGLLRFRQRRERRVRPLAGRRLRFGRQRRLRPQEDGHHRARRVGKRQAPLPRDGRRHRSRRTSRSPASATCRATCSATACCSPATSSSWPPSTTGTSSSTPIRIRRRASGNASACSRFPARRGRTTTSRSSPKAAASIRAPSSPSRSPPRRERPWESPMPRLRRANCSRRSSRRPWISSTTGASAPT